MPKLPFVPVPENIFVSKSSVNVRPQFNEAPRIDRDCALKYHSIGRLGVCAFVLGMGPEKSFHDDVSPRYNCTQLLVAHEA
jgi:hypothetical protein